MRRTLAFTMPTGFDEAFRRIKELVADFRVNGKLHNCCIHRCDGPPRDGVLRSPDRQIDAPVYDLYGLTAAEIKILEGAAT